MDTSKNTNLQNDDVKNAINIATIELIESVGIENLKIRDICEKAGVSIGTFYNYFENKNDLMFNRIQYMGKHLKDEVFHKLIGTPAERLKQILLAYTKNSSKRGVAYSSAVFLAIQTNRSTLEEEENLDLYQMIKSIIDDGQENGDFRTDFTSKGLARMITTFIRGINIDWCHMNGEYDIMEFASKSLDILIDGLTKTKEDDA